MKNGVSVGAVRFLPVCVCRGGPGEDAKRCFCVWCMFLLVCVCVCVCVCASVRADEYVKQCAGVGGRGRLKMKNTEDEKRCFYVGIEVL
jgi:hypothetical protein